MAHTWQIILRNLINWVFAQTRALLSLSQVQAKIHFGSFVQVGKCEPEPVATLSSGSWGSGRELIWSGHFGGTNRWRMVGGGKGVQEEVPPVERWMCGDNGERCVLSIADSDRARYRWNKCFGLRTPEYVWSIFGNPFSSALKLMVSLV